MTLERENQHFPYWVNFLLPFSKNIGNIYRQNWLDLSLDYFDEKCHYSCDILRQSSSYDHADWYMDMQLVDRSKKEAF